MTQFWLILIAFLSGLAGAFQIPTLSLFLSSELSSNLQAIGLFYSVNALTGIVISLWLAVVSDRLIFRRRLVIFCYLAAVANGLLFAFCRHYLVLICAGSFLMALANSAIPQLFALAREHRSHPRFNSLLRAQLSLAWVLGPPLAFSLVSAVGFDMLYLCTAMIFLFVMVLLFLVPDKGRRPATKPGGPAQANPIPLTAGILFLASTLMWSCSALYLIDIPVYLTSQLGLAPNRVGIMMGLAALLEIPVILLVGRYVVRMGNRKILIWGQYAGMLFFTGLSLASLFWQLLLLQIFNAIFIGVIATSGMFIFQSLLHQRQGLATTLFTNSVSVGIIIAGLLQSIIKNQSHTTLYTLAVILLVLSRGVLTLVHTEQDDAI